LSLGRQGKNYFQNVFTPNKSGDRFLATSNASYSISVENMATHIIIPHKKPVLNFHTYMEILFPKM
jgi:hypothetical protein